MPFFVQNLYKTTGFQCIKGYFEPITKIPVDGFGLGWEGVIDFKIIGATDRRAGL